MAVLCFEELTFLRAGAIGVDRAGVSTERAGPRIAHICRAVALVEPAELTVDRAFAAGASPLARIGLDRSTAVVDAVDAIDAGADPGVAFASAPRDPEMLPLLS